MTDPGQLLDFNTAKPLAQIEAEHRARATVDADDIKARLNANPRAFVEWLFSGRAHISRGEARIGDIAGTPGASLAIQLAGPNVGLWHDHATGEGGDLIALYQSYMGYQGGRNFQLALKEIAKEFLGDPVEVRRADWQPSAADRIAEKKQKLGTKPREDMQQLGAPVATYRYQDLQGNQVASVVRFEPNGTRASKTFRPYCLQEVNGRREWRPGAPERHRPLYRLPSIIRASTVVLCEGEGKADALASLGIDATSAMQGSKAPIDKTDWDALRGKTVIIWPDNDETGQAYARAVAAHLAAIGCTVCIVPMPAEKPTTWDAGDCVAEGGDPHEYLARAVPWAEVADPKPRIRILDMDELEEQDPPEWLVDRLITKRGLIVLWGRSGDLKSFAALDICMSVATGAAWHGRAVAAGLVVYVAAEGAAGLASRAIGWRQHKAGAVKPNFKLVPHGLTLTGEDLDHLVAAIIALPERPALVVIDTLARTFGSGDENKQSDMNAYVTASDRLREATGAAVMIVHHSGVHEDKRERGSNVLRGAADTIIKVARKGDHLQLINKSPEGKQKDAEEAETVCLRVQKVTYQSKRGERSTLVLMPDDDPLPSTATHADVSPAYGKIERAILGALKDAKEPLGLTRLTAMAGAQKASVYKAAKNLVSKEAIVEMDQTDNSPTLWRLV